MPDAQLRDLTYGARSRILMAFATRLGVVDWAQSVFFGLLDRVEVHLVGGVHRLPHEVGIDGLVVETARSLRRCPRRHCPAEQHEAQNQKSCGKHRRLFHRILLGKAPGLSTDLFSKRNPSRWVGHRVPQSKHSELEGCESQYIWVRLILKGLYLVVQEMIPTSLFALI